MQLKLIFTERLCTWPHFESEDFWNSEVACESWSLTRVVARTAATVCGKEPRCNKASLQRTYFVSPFGPCHMEVTAYCSSYHETTNTLGYLKLKLVCSILCFSRRSATYLRSVSSKNLGCSWYGGGSGRGDAMCSTRFALSNTLAFLQSQPKGSWEGRFAFHFPMCHCLSLAFPPSFLLHAKTFHDPLRLRRKS